MEELNLETRIACNTDCGDQSRKCPVCGADMMQDKATGEWICPNCGK